MGVFIINKNYMLSQHGFNKAQINFTIRRNGQDEVLEKSIMVNIRTDDVNECYELYEFLKDKFSDEVTVQQVPFRGDEYAKPKLSCPECKVDLVQRTAKNGKNAGSKFWGCRNYPNCRFTLANNS